MTVRETPQRRPSPGVLWVLWCSMVVGLSGPALAGDCGYYEPEVEFFHGSQTGQVSVRVAGHWPNVGADVEVTVEPPDGQGVLRLDVSGEVAGLPAVGHYDRQVDLPPLDSGPYTLAVFIVFTDAGIEDACGIHEFGVTPGIPTVRTGAAVAMALLLAFVGCVVLRRAGTF